jgi:hypothetical protein
MEMVDVNETEGKPEAEYKKLVNGVLDWAGDSNLDDRLSDFEADVYAAKGQRMLFPGDGLRQRAFLVLAAIELGDWSKEQRHAAVNDICTLSRYAAGCVPSDAEEQHRIERRLFASDDWTQKLMEDGDRTLDDAIETILDDAVEDADENFLVLSRTARNIEFLRSMFAIPTETAVQIITDVLADHGLRPDVAE